MAQMRAAFQFKPDPFVLHGTACAKGAWRLFICTRIPFHVSEGGRM